MKLEVGKYYRTRDGRKIGPLADWNLLGSAYKWRWGGLLWMLDGTAFGGDNPHQDLIAEWSDAAPEVGTLQEIGAQVGDAVENIDFENEVYYVQGSNDPYGRGLLWASKEKAHTKGDLWNSREYGWRIISRAQAQSSPVRTVTTTRQVIVPGVYGPWWISPYIGDEIMVTIGMRNSKDDTMQHLTSDELDGAIKYLVSVLDAMKANTAA